MVFKTFIVDGSIFEECALDEIRIKKGDFVFSQYDDKVHRIENIPKHLLVNRLTGTNLPFDEETGLLNNPINFPRLC